MYNNIESEIYNYNIIDRLTKNNKETTIVTRTGESCVIFSKLGTL